MSRWSSRSRALRAACALALCAFAVAARAQAQTQDGWSLLSSSDGVSVFERGGAERAIPELRGVVEIDAPLATVLAVIADVPGQTSWLHNCVESRVVKRESATTTLVYNRTAAPWPASDRDVALLTTIETSGPEAARLRSSAEVRFHAVADPAAPEVAGVVRMPKLDGEFALVALAPARTRVEYRLDLDPGGSLPAWLARRTARELPLESLRALRRYAVALAP